jgi:hypothetical protein
VGRGVNTAMARERVEVLTMRSTLAIRIGLTIPRSRRGQSFLEVSGSNPAVGASESASGLGDRGPQNAAKAVDGRSRHHEPVRLSQNALHRVGLRTRLDSICEACRSPISEVAVANLSGLITLISN